jgi:hypothetical protein
MANYNPDEDLGRKIFGGLALFGCLAVLAIGVVIVLIATVVKVWFQ